MSDDVRVTNWPSADTKEEVALQLLKLVARAEERPVLGDTDVLDRKYILDLYAECLQATGGYSNRTV